MIQGFCSTQSWRTQPGCLSRDCSRAPSHFYGPCGPGTELPPCQPQPAPAGQKGVLKERPRLVPCPCQGDSTSLGLWCSPCIPTEPQHPWDLEGPLEMFNPQLAACPLPDLWGILQSLSSNLPEQWLSLEVSWHPVMGSCTGQPHQHPVKRCRGVLTWPQLGALVEKRN